MSINLILYATYDVDTKINITEYFKLVQVPAEESLKISSSSNPLYSYIQYCTERFPLDTIEIHLKELYRFVFSKHANTLKWKAY